MSDGDLITTGRICELLGFQITTAFLTDVLLVQPARKERNGTLWRKSDLPLISELLRDHVEKALEGA